MNLSLIFNLTETCPQALLQLKRFDSKPDGTPDAYSDMIRLKNRRDTHVSEELRHLF